MTPAEHQAQLDRLAAKGILCGTPQLINLSRTTMTPTRRLAAAPPVAPGAASIPTPDDEKAIQMIAAAMQMSADDLAALADAVAKFLAPFAAEDVAARRSLSKREIDMCRTKKLRPSTYARTRAAMLARSPRRA